MMDGNLIKADSKVTLRYAVSLADGTVIEETGDRKRFSLVRVNL